jgi:hypothetical protein
MQMKKSSGFINFLLSYLAILLNLGYLFIEPLIFATVGLIYQVSWPYYLITIGGFAVLMVLWEAIAYVALRDSEKKFHCPFIRKLNRIRTRLAEADNSDDLPREDN